MSGGRARAPKSAQARDTPLSQILAQRHGTRKWTKAETPARARPTPVVRGRRRRRRRVRVAGERTASSALHAREGPRCPCRRPNPPGLRRARRRKRRHLHSPQSLGKKKADSSVRSLPSVSGNESLARRRGSCDRRRRRRLLLLLLFLLLLLILLLLRFFPRLGRPEEKEPSSASGGGVRHALDRRLGDGVSRRPRRRPSSRFPPVLGAPRALFPAGESRRRRRLLSTRASPSL